MGTVIDQHEHSAHEFPVVVLNTGARMSALVFGSELQSPAEDIKKAVLSAIQLGYRHFDTAAAHGTEVAVGEGIAEAISSGLIHREDIFVTLKFHANSAAGVAAALKKSLSALQLDYVDLCLLHCSVKIRKGFSFPPKDDFALPSSTTEDAWRALEECMHSGLTKAIGVSNFSVKELKDLLLHAKVVPSVDQVELHPFWQEKQLHEFCRSVGVRICALHPLGSVLHPVYSNAVLKAIAEKHNKSPGQISLRWLIENGIAPIVASYDAEKLSEYIKIFDFKLSQDDVEQIESLEQRRLGLPC